MRHGGPGLSVAPLLLSDRKVVELMFHTARASFFSQHAKGSSHISITGLKLPVKLKKKKRF